MDCFANEAAIELFRYDAMTEACMFKFMKGHIEYLAQHLQPVKCIVKGQNVLPTAGKGFIADNQSENEEWMIKLQQAMFQLDAYEKLR